MIDPDVGRAVKSDGITTPDVLRVQVSDLKILENDIVCAACEAETLATDDAVSANSQDGLVAGDHERVGACLVVGHFDLRCLGLFGVAPVAGVDSQLARGSGTIGSAACLGGGAFGASEIEGLGDDDGERSRLF